MVEIVGILAFLTNVWANILIARKSETGWIIRLVSNVLWLAFGIWALSIANILNAITFAGINIYGLTKWRRERLMQTTCSDHYKVTCKYCRQIVRQCRCLPSGDKPSTVGICGVCVAMLPPQPDEGTGATQGELP